MYLRQLVLAVEDLDRTVDDACAIFDTKVVHSDPGVAEYGVRNAVIALGNHYIELMEPIDGSAPAARFLARHGEGLYAVLMQCEDYRRYRAIAQGLGVRLILEVEHGNFRCFQLHPTDAQLPVILEIDEQPGGPSGPYYPAGNGFPETGPRPRTGISAVEVVTPRPDRAADRWRQLLGHAETVGSVRFVDRSPSRATVHVTVGDLDSDRTVQLAGVRFVLEPS